MRAYISSDLTFITVCIYSYSNKIEVFVLQIESHSLFRKQFGKSIVIKKITITIVFCKLLSKKTGAFNLNYTS